MPKRHRSPGKDVTVLRGADHRLRVVRELRACHRRNRQEKSGPRHDRHAQPDYSPQTGRPRIGFLNPPTALKRTLSPSEGEREGVRGQPGEPRLAGKGAFMALLFMMSNKWFVSRQYL